MQILGNVHATVSRLRNMYGSQIHNLSNAERIMLRYLMDNHLWQM